MKLDEYKRHQNPLSHCAIRIGIDPGVKTGVAIYFHEESIWVLNTMSFWAIVDLVESYDPHLTGIAIETPNTKRVLYSRKDGDSEGRGRERMAANVGSNRREAALLAERFESLGYPVIRVTPTRTKWTAADLKRETGITERTNEHERDAVRIVSKYI